MKTDLIRCRWCQGDRLCERYHGRVGSTIIYAHRQATGMVNDHTTDCFRRMEAKALGWSAGR